MKISPKRSCDSNALSSAQLMGSHLVQTPGSWVPWLKSCGLKPHELSRAVIVTLKAIPKIEPTH